MGYGIDPNYKDYILLMLEFLYHHLNAALEKGHGKLTKEQTMSLFEPALDWLY